MKTKFTSILKDKCKDFGLTDKAIADLVELGFEGLTDESSEEDLSKSVEKIVPFAKMMQKEITRKTTKKSQSEEKPSKEEGKGNEGEGEGVEMPAWAKALNDKMDALKAENDSLKAEKAKSDRKSSIQATAKKMGIPEALMKHYHIEDDADIEQSLTEYKQDLISSNLMPKDATHESSRIEAQMQESALDWAKNLPNK